VNDECKRILKKVPYYPSTFLWGVVIPATYPVSGQIFEPETSILRLHFRNVNVFENRLLRGRDEVAGEWKKLHNEELRDLYSSPSIITMIKSRRMRRWTGHVARKGKKRNAYCMLVGKPQGKSPLGRP
jgi:hypothetical protein